MAKAIDELSLVRESAENDMTESGLSQLRSIESSIRTLTSLLDSLESSGLLRIASAFMEHYDDTLKVVVDQASKKGTANALHNLLLGYTLLSNLDNERLSALTGEISETLNSMDKFRSDPPLGLYALMRIMKDPDVSAGVRAMLKILASLANKK